MKDATEAGEQRAVAHAPADPGGVARARPLRARCRHRRRARRGRDPRHAAGHGRRSGGSEIARCEACARVDRAEQEAEEIGIIERFLPRPDERAGDRRRRRRRRSQAVGATRLKDTGQVIAALKERYNGQMDFACAKRLLCQRLH